MCGIPYRSRTTSTGEERPSTARVPSRCGMLDPKKEVQEARNRRATERRAAFAGRREGGAIPVTRGPPGGNRTRFRGGARGRPGKRRASLPPFNERVFD